MKILIVSDAWYPQVNGVVRTYEYLREELVKKGHDVRIIGPSDFPVRMAMPGYGEIKLALLPYRRLARLITEYGPDTIHIATEGPLGQAARKYCRKHKTVFTSSYHTHFPDYVAKRVGRFLPFLSKPVHEVVKNWIRAFHSPSKALMIATQSLEDELTSWGFEAPMYRLTRGVRMDVFFPGKKTVFRDLKGPVALYVGRVAIEKNIEDFLEMEWDGSKVVVGDGPALQELKERYPEALFTGIKTGRDLAECYRSADLFVFPSRTDTFGIVLIEALASGLPVAGYTVTGPRDIITNDMFGALEETDLGLAARRAMEINSEEARNSRVRHVKTHYTWEATATQFEKALENA